MYSIVAYESMLISIGIPHTVQITRKVAFTRTHGLAWGLIITGKKAWQLFRLRVSLKRTQGWMLASETGATLFSPVIIKPRANPRVRVNVMLHVICTISWGCDWICKRVLFLTHKIWPIVLEIWNYITF